MTLPKKVNGTSDPYQDPTSIGNLAIEKGFATRVQVLNALRKQEVRVPLGEILVEDGVLTHGQLESLLIDQEILRGRFNRKKAAQFIRDKKREKMREVSEGLRDFANSLSLIAKHES